MRPRILRIIAGLLMLFAIPVAGVAQTVVPRVEAQATAPLAPEQLDQLLAPIALYPDQLLAQILMAATYPLEVVQADRWLKDPANAALRGDQLAAALEPMDWDPSVKALVPFPQILAMMDQHLDWTQSLGDAFLAQQDEVMDSVQRLRREALAAGNLRSSPELTVTPVGETIVIVAANPAVVYVPVYNPILVYGTWRYPAYPPYYFPPPPGFYRGPAYFTGVRFSIGFAVVSFLWGWDECDWVRRRLVVDYDRYNVINRYLIEHANRPVYTRSVWVHDPYHRRGVVYRDIRIRERFRSGTAGSPETRRTYRGFAPGAKPAATAVRPSAGTPKPQGRAIEQRREGPVTTKPPTAAAPRTAVRPAPKTAVAPAHAKPAVRHPAPAASRTPPPAFEGYARGAEVKAQADRGRASIQHRATGSRSAAPQPKTPPSGATAKPAPSTGSGNRGRPGRRLPDGGDKRGQ